MDPDISFMDYAFQSPLPARGATLPQKKHWKEDKSQSPLPARGATWDGTAEIAATAGFQSPLPARGATGAAHRQAQSIRYFNPRSPRGERPDGPRGRPPVGHFNPRSPRGERRLCSGGDKARDYISIPAPREGSDDADFCCKFFLGISIPAPREGSDGRAERRRRRDWYFNPRSPRGERPTVKVLAYFSASFQSPLPARGATVWRGCGCSLQYISIPAPREGSDRQTRTRNTF